MEDKRDTSVQVPPAAEAMGCTMTVEDVQTAYGVSRNTVYRWISGGRLEAVKIGNRNYFRPADVEAVATSYGGRA